jgi:hypothetical protein
MVDERRMSVSLRLGSSHRRLDLCAVAGGLGMVDSGVDRGLDGHVIDEAATAIL